MPFCSLREPFSLSSTPPSRCSGDDVMGAGDKLDDPGCKDHRTRSHMHGPAFCTGTRFQMLGSVRDLVDDQGSLSDLPSSTFSFRVRGSSSSTAAIFGLKERYPNVLILVYSR